MTINKIANKDNQILISEEDDDKGQSWDSRSYISESMKLFSKVKWWYKRSYKWQYFFGIFKQSIDYLNCTVGLTMRPDLLHAKACERPKVNDLSGHWTTGVMRVPHLFCKKFKRWIFFPNNLWNELKELWKSENRQS